MSSASRRPIVALTGATGFIGQHLLEHLLTNSLATDDDGFAPRLRCLVRSPQRQQRPDNADLHWVKGDLESTATLSELVRGADIVVHNAGVVRGRTAEDFLTVNAEGTRRLAQVAQQAGVKRFILISSLAAREPQLSFYAASKAAAEGALQNTTGLPWVIVRPPAVYGPGDKELAPLFDSMRRGIGAHPAGAVSRFSLIHVSDLASFIRHLVVMPTLTNAVTEGEAAGPDGHIFEPEDGHKGYSWEEIRHCAEEAFQRKVRMLPIPRWVLSLSAQANLSLSQILNYSPMLSPGKVRELTHDDWVCRTFPVDLGWRPRIGLVEGLVGSQQD